MCIQLYYKITGAKGDLPSESRPNEPAGHCGRVLSPRAAVQSGCPHFSASAKNHTGKERILFTSSMICFRQIIIFGL